MKLYNSMGPNPHMVRMYAAELGVELAMEEVDLMGGENRQAAYLPRTLQVNARRYSWMTARFSRKSLQFASTLMTLPMENTDWQYARREGQYAYVDPTRRPKHL